jgi:protein SCO1/2
VRCGIRRANLPDHPPERRPHRTGGALRRALLAALVAASALAAGGCGSTDSGGSTAGHGSQFAVAEPLPPGLAGRAAPPIRLADARGGTFDTRSLKGKPYLVTFLYANCPDVCPLIGAQLRDTLEQLGDDARRVAVVAVSVDPRGDTPAAVRTWLRRQHEPAQFHYLIGPEPDIAPVWRAWYAAPQIPGDPESAHTAVVWIVDARGRLTAKVAAGQPFDANGLARDVRSLLTSPRA